MKVKVNEIDGEMYVSEYTQVPGHTEIKHYQVEF